MPEHSLRLLALDGGGVRGLSSLLILKQLMLRINPIAPPRPCDCFDMIGGTSTGGLIAIMLAVGLTVDECINAYTTLSERVFRQKKRALSMKGRTQGRFGSAELEREIKAMIKRQRLDENALLSDVNLACKVFVCTTSCETGKTVRFRSYCSPRQCETTVKIWQAARATSAATSFFDRVTIDSGESFVDGATGANNPIWEVWNEAKDVWPSSNFDDQIQCVVSIGTGIRSLVPFQDSLLGVFKSLKAIATETEPTAEQFVRVKSGLEKCGRYFRFDVLSGLESIGLEESKRMNAIRAATRLYIESEAVFNQMQACTNSMTGKSC
ncbi:FabD/lysophospholipase-like protein [Byssothecium circinans]|uniref:FabD/lysophospholipase-like protein n=1 Tax=Byssothecium circinans TaxID=147558 RepID=A0A6A5T9C1_9PLEO|nr:FabD/lysophospholipase-like protein [Byssothecium circinans]